MRTLLRFAPVLLAALVTAAGQSPAPPQPAAELSALGIEVVPLSTNFHDGQFEGARFTITNHSTEPLTAVGVRWDLYLAGQSEPIESFPMRLDFYFHPQGGLAPGTNLVEDFPIKYRNPSGPVAKAVPSLAYVELADGTIGGDAPQPFRTAFKQEREAELLFYRQLRGLVVANNREQIVGLLESPTAPIGESSETAFARLRLRAILDQRGLDAVVQELLRERRNP